MFAPLPDKFSFPESEQEVLEFWDKHKIFEQSLAQRAGAERFVFYEGPPTANGLPHPGHCLTRAIKDLFPRYQTMCGKLVERKAGWDTHGLPVEVEVCKELGIHTKEEIEQYGVEKFVRLCIDSVFRYVREWEQMTRRLGFWVNLEEAYVTFHQSYVESVWWGLKTLYERGLLYQGHKVVWWWAQGGTALSAGEVGEGYRTVQDPSVFVRFPLVAEGLRDCGIEGLSPDKAVSLLVWTTTPWTLVSNHFAAVGPDIDYAIVDDKALGEHLIIAAALVESTMTKMKHEFEVVGTCKGTDLVGLRYIPPFPDVYHKDLGDKTAELKDGGAEHLGWRITLADFVTLDSGTGLVHEAPAYGEVDFELLQAERKRFVDELNSIPLINAVGPDGKYTDEAPAAYRGRWVKDCDKDIIRELKERGVLLHQETIEHEYPFCPRAEDDPLIQYARQSWFVRTSQFKDEFLKNNAGIYWLPDHIREGRFGDFLRNNVDWALSRERFWGTPLPIWRCEQTGQMEAIGSLDELKAKPGATDATDEYPDGMWATKKQEDPDLPDHLMAHKPYIDAWTYDSPFVEEATKGSAPRMRRVPEVIDCWWDAGSMPFAQWGFPHAPGSVETFAERFPANFISEALDQTRGWFYGLLAISTLLFGEQRDNGKLPGDGILPDPHQGHPYQSCIVLGLMLGEDGLKMSKRKKNYREPTYIFDHYGADALRWFLFSGQTPWTSIRFEEQNIRDAHREFLVRLYNVFSFFNIYANIDGFAVSNEAGTQSGSDGGAAPSAPLPLREALGEGSSSASPIGRGTGWRPVAERSELDRWIISELHRTTEFVRQKMDALENYPAAGRLNEFVDALSNWYVRRSRDRFWKSQKDQDKWDGYNTLYEVLLTLSKLIAPFTPYFAETMYQNLIGTEGAGSAGLSADTGTSIPQSLNPSIPLSVHLCDYPAVDDALVDERLAQEMDLVRQIVSLGRGARTAAKLRVRQPLALAEIILARQEHADWLQAHSELIAEELNIKRIEFTTEADHYVTYQVKPNFKSIGPKFGKLGKQVAAALNQVDPAEVRRTLDAGHNVELRVNDQAIFLSEEDVDVRLEAKPGWSASQGRGGVVVVKTELTDELIQEGLTREVIHHVQSIRKNLNLAYEARIRLQVETESDLQAVIERFADTIRRECLVETLAFGPVTDADAHHAKVEKYPVRLAVEVVKT